MDIENVNEDLRYATFIYNYELPLPIQNYLCTNQENVLLVRNASFAVEPIKVKISPLNSADKNFYIYIF